MECPLCNTPLMGALIRRTDGKLYHKMCNALLTIGGEYMICNTCRLPVIFEKKDYIKVVSQSDGELFWHTQCWTHGRRHHANPNQGVLPLGVHPVADDSHGDGTVPQPGRNGVGWWRTPVCHRHGTTCETRCSRHLQEAEGGVRMRPLQHRNGAPLCPIRQQGSTGGLSGRAVGCGHGILQTSIFAHLKGGDSISLADVTRYPHVFLWERVDFIYT